MCTSYAICDTLQNAQSLTFKPLVLGMFYTHTFQQSFRSKMYCYGPQYSSMPKQLEWVQIGYFHITLPHMLLHLLYQYTCFDTYTNVLCPQHVWVCILLCWVNSSLPSVTKWKYIYLFKSCHQVHLAASIFINNINLFQLCEGDWNFVAFHPFQLYEVLYIESTWSHLGREYWHSFLLFIY